MQDDKAQQLRRARGLLALSQMGVGQVLGCNRNTVSRYERGELDIPENIPLALVGWGYLTGGAYTAQQVANTFDLAVRPVEPPVTGFEVESINLPELVG